MSSAQCVYIYPRSRSAGLSLVADIQGQHRRLLVSPQANAISYNTAIHACARVGEWELAQSLLQEMRGLGLEVDHISFGATVSSLCFVPLFAAPRT